MKGVKVSIVIGSENDLDVMKEAKNVLDEFGISSEMTIASAHRSPERIAQYAKMAEERGIEVIIAGAGMAAHLAGAIASRTLCPVIGVPIDSSSLRGLDALLSTVQMPSGVPVATMAIGRTGAINAAYLAIQILALRDRRLLERLKRHRLEMEKKIEERARTLEEN